MPETRTNRDSSKGAALSHNSPEAREIPSPARKDIDDFLACRRLAFVGVSRKPKDFTRMLYREFQSRGYDVAPVNPGAPEIDGKPCFARVSDITPAVEGVMLLTPAAAATEAVRDCLAAGVRRIWMYRAAGPGAVSAEAVELCRANGVAVVPGACPFMFLPDTQWPHRFHGFLKKLVGRYPN